MKPKPKSNARLAARLRAEFPTPFLEDNPELTQLLIDAACALEREQEGATFYVVAIGGMYAREHVGIWTRQLGVATRFGRLSDARRMAADWAKRSGNDKPVEVRRITISAIESASSRLRVKKG